MRRGPSSPPSELRGSGSPAAAARTRSRARTPRRGCGARPAPAAGSAGSALPGACLSGVTELAQKRARLAFDVVGLLGGQIPAPAADRAVVHGAKRLGDRLRIRLQPLGNFCGRSHRIRRDLLVPDLERVARDRAREDDVAPPCPGCTRRLARSRELFSPLRLDPGTHVRTVRLADVVAARSLAKPAALEQR